MYSRIFALSIALASLCLVACKNDPTSSAAPNHFITVSLDGAAEVTFDEPISTLASYIVSDSISFVTSATDSLAHISVLFKGNSVGTYNVAWQEGLSADYNFDVLYWKSGTEVYGMSKSGSVIITAFGAVGERVVGTFDAILTDLSDDATALASVHVAGSFSVMRATDVR